MAKVIINPTVAAKGRPRGVVMRFIRLPNGTLAIPPGVCPALICRPRILSVTKRGVDNQVEHKSSLPAYYPIPAVRHVGPIDARTTQTDQARVDSQAERLE